jgi:hypothetical protein
VQAPPTEAVVPGPGGGGGGVAGGKVEEVGAGLGPLRPDQGGGPRRRPQQGAEGALGGLDHSEPYVAERDVKAAFLAVILGAGYADGDQHVLVSAAAWRGRRRAGEGSEGGGGGVHLSGSSCSGSPRNRRDRRMTERRTSWPPAAAGPAGRPPPSTWAASQGTGWPGLWAGIDRLPQAP